MTKAQQLAQRNLEAAQAEWLRSYNWQAAEHGRWKHRHMPQANPRGYTTADAMVITRAEPIRYGGSR